MIYHARMRGPVCKREKPRINFKNGFKTRFNFRETLSLKSDRLSSRELLRDKKTSVLEFKPNSAIRDGHNVRDTH